MNMSSFHAKRRIAAWLQAALMLGVPFLRIGGESALRFDVPSLKLYFFGSVIWISEAYFFLLVFLLFFIGVMLITVLYGRIWYFPI
jgi:polyferredoxin